MIVPAFQTIISIVVISVASSDVTQGISRVILNNWTSKFGGPLFEFGRSVTKYDELLKRFQYAENSSVQKIELDKLIVEMTSGIKVALDKKVEAIRKIMLWAEERALEFYELPPDQRPSSPTTYYNAKKLNSESFDPDDDLYHVVKLKYEKHFGASVNSSFSSIHVPTSIYEKKDTLLEAIGWTQQMDSTFESNYLSNPTLSYQYFGSTTGFLRQYPATKWPNENSDRQNPDLYDCRTRQWYVAAANSPKNMIILQDVSGSMTGIRREIAKHVVSTILDTLTENDYVNVYNFSDETYPVVECFANRLVQANLENIRVLKDSLDQDHTAGVANFSSALHNAFDILERQFNTAESSTCNQAIMIITDGSPYPYEEIFKSRQNPMHTARVFTYLIGRDVTDKREVMYMACANNGYYVHVSTLSEVQEEVLKYIPVMSRPMVMHQHHSVVWTPVYADIAEIAETDWSWSYENSRRQYRRSERYKQFLKDRDVIGPIVYGTEDETARLRAYLDEEDYALDPPVALAITAKQLSHRINNLHVLGNLNNSKTLEQKKRNFNFVISAAIPVFDNRNSTAEGDRIANLLGVAGTDTSLKDLKKIVSPFKLGVNGYSFMVNNNGYIVYHPDHRPIFRDELLKPNYNTVDISEVELVDNDSTVRNNDTDLLTMRKEMIDLERGYRSLNVRVHQDDFRRVVVRRQKYEYKKIKGTPYTLGLVAPANLNQFDAQIELFRDRNFENYLNTDEEPRKWAINPDWVYCEYIRGGPHFEKKEDLLLHFLHKIQDAKNSFKWKNDGLGLKQRHASKKLHIIEGDIYSCDKELVQSLAFDANVTEVFHENKLTLIHPGDKKLIELNGATMAFLATRSGLTRWIDFQKNSKNDFIKTNRRATEETWYKRAVERYEIDENSFVYSVPFDAGNRNDTKVTATRAIFVTKNGLKAPVAVVGVQYNHSEWANQFFDITSSCMEGTARGNYVDGSCKKTCESGEYDCFVLDDNGYILISEKPEQTGRFFGEIDGMVMEMLVNSDVYRRTRVVDHQAVCFEPVSKSNFGNFLQTPLDHMRNLGTWVLSTFAWLILNLNLHTVFNPDLTSVFADYYASNEYTIVEDTVDSLHPFLELASINKTRLRPCDKETFLYNYGSSYNPHNFTYHGLLTKCGHASECDGYFNVHVIPHTNLIMVVTDGKCHCGMNSSTISAKEVIYEGECAFVNKQVLPRERPATCINYNANERDIQEDCGGGSSLKYSCLLISLLAIITYFINPSTIINV